MDILDVEYDNLTGVYRLEVCNGYGYAPARAFLQWLSYNYGYRYVDWCDHISIHGNMYNAEKLRDYLGDAAHLTLIREWATEADIEWKIENPADEAWEEHRRKSGFRNV